MSHNEDSTVIEPLRMSAAANKGVQDATIAPASPVSSKPKKKNGTSKKSLSDSPRNQGQQVTAEDPLTPKQSSVNEAQLKTPRGANKTHLEMRSVLDDLRSDFRKSSSTEAVQLLESLDTASATTAGLSGGATVIALREELRAAKAAVRVLKLDKERTHHKLERLDSLLVKERSSLRDVLQAARKAFADLKLEKENMRKKLHAERKKHAAQLQGCKEDRRNLEEEMARMQGKIRDLEKTLADQELAQMPEEARSAIAVERAHLEAALDSTTKQHDEDAAEVIEIDDDMQRLFAEFMQAMGDMESEFVKVHRDERQAELANEQTRARVQKVTETAKGDKERLQTCLGAQQAETARLRAMLQEAGVDPGPLLEYDVNEYEYDNEDEFQYEDL